MPGPLNGNLAGASCNDILVARCTALRVVNRSKPILLCFHFFKDEAAIVEGARLSFGVGYFEVYEANVTIPTYQGLLAEQRIALGLNSGPQAPTNLHILP